MVRSQSFCLPLDQLPEHWSRSVPPRLGVGVDVRRSLRLPPLHSVFRGDKQPVFVPLLARARLPLRPAQVAELVSAAARHVVAPDRELDEVSAARAALPALALREREHARILGRRTRNAGQVPRRLAARARHGSTCGARETFRVAGRCAEECGAGWTVTVNAILGSELYCFSVEACCEVAVQVGADSSDIEGLFAA